MNNLVSVDWLKEHLDDDNLIVLDARLSPSNDPFIPNARFFDLKGKFSDQEAMFPNTFPTVERFEKECQRLGICTDSMLVVYDPKGVYSSPRVWWMFTAMGHHNVAVLDGGLPAWLKNDYPTADVEGSGYLKGDFNACFDADLVKRYEDILSNVSTPSFTVVDARSEGRFNGIDDEPRPHLKSGCIPNSVNIPYEHVLEDGKFKGREELKAIFNASCSFEDKLVFSCGSGLTACIILLACELAFKQSRFVYDGSWTEWAEKQGLIK